MRSRRRRLGPASLALVVALGITTALVGCAMDRHRAQVREGFLTRGLHREAFLAEWGIPSRTFSVPACNPALRADPYGTSWPIYEVWEYPARATCLTFDGVRLMFWETGATECQPKERCEPRGAPPPPPPHRG